MTDFKHVAERFKQCPKPECSKINPPVSLFCTNCKTKMMHVVPIHFNSLPKETNTALQPNTHEIFAGKNPEEFVDGIIRLAGGMTLTLSQKEIRQNLEFHLATIRSGLARDAKFRGKR